MHLDRIDPAFGNWFAGYVDGEGCFYVRRNINRYGDKEYLSYGCSLTFAARDDDLPLLVEIQYTLGMGVLSRRHQGPAQGTRGNPSASLSIHNKQDVLFLAALFGAYPLRSKKQKDYEVWRRAVMEWHRERGAKTRGRDWSVMEALHQELKAVRRYQAA